MEDISDEDRQLQYNALCTFYSDLVVTSQSVVYLIYRGDYIFYTHNKEKALLYINDMLSLYLQDSYVPVEIPLENTNEMIIFEAFLNRGGDNVHIKAVEVPALKDMGRREQYQPQTGTMYFYILQLDKNTIYRGYTSFFGDAVSTEVEAVDKFTGGPDKKYFWTTGISRHNKRCILKVVDRLHRITQTSFAHTDGKYTKEIPVFEFYKVLELKN